MFIIENYSTAVLFCFVTMLCWGSWANTQKLASEGWRFELFYWDYVIGILITSLLFAFTLGSMGEGGRSFLADYQQAEASNIRSALIGGAVFNVANILLVAAISIAGMSVAFPVGIGLALVVGVIVNYLDNPLGNSTSLFLGVALVVAAILLNARAYRNMSIGSTVSTKGLALSVIAGLLMGLFYKYVANSMFPDFTNPLPGKLSPYTAVVIFATGIFLSNFVINTALMYRPFVGSPVSFKDYCNGNLRSHLMGILGGSIWCIGMSFSILASDKAGAAISYGLGQGATIVAAIWGIFIWKEFKDAPKGTSTLLNIMLLCYLVGLGMIIMAR
ncbi:MAG: GRP family sugar transporter [Bacteroidetes bacterium]|nr:GRP family sugar transporter [Bacteroidota bacterium]